jgi:hypothetical protein
MTVIYLVTGPLAAIGLRAMRRRDRWQRAGPATPPAALPALPAEPAAPPTVAPTGPATPPAGPATTPGELATPGARTAPPAVPPAREASR